MSSLSAPYRALTLGMITLVTLVAFEAVAVTTAMPTVARALDGLTLYALAFGGALAASVVGMVVAGAWGDARGPAGPTWAGVALFIAGLFIAGTAPDMWVLVGGRAVQGFGGGLVVVALYVVVGRAYPADLHPRVFAAFAGAWVLPSIAGPSIAGLIVEVIQTDVFIPLMLTRERGFSPSAAGLTLTVGGLAWSLGSWYQSRLGQRLGPQARLTLGLSLIAVGVAAAAAVVAPAVPVPVVVGGWLLGGFGMGVSYPTMSALTLQLAPAGQQGRSSSSLQLSDSLHSTTVLAVSGTLFTALVATAPSAAYLAGYGLAFGLAVAGIWVSRRTSTPAGTRAPVPVG